MSKVCENCGFQLNDTDEKCPNCGTPVATAAENKDVKESTATNTTANTTKAPSGDNKKLFAIIGASAAGALLLVIIILVVLAGGYKKPIKNYYNGLQKTSSIVYSKAYPTFMRLDVLEKYTDGKLQKRMDSLEDDYGEKVKLSYKIVDKIKLDKEDLEDAKEDIKRTYKDEKVKVTEGYTVCLKTTIKGSKDTDTKFTTFDVYKVNGKWCMID